MVKAKTSQQGSINQALALSEQLNELSAYYKNWIEKKSQHKGQHEAGLNKEVLILWYLVNTLVEIRKIQEEEEEKSKIEVLVAGGPILGPIQELRFTKPAPNIIPKLSNLIGRGGHLDTWVYHALTHGTIEGNIGQAPSSWNGTREDWDKTSKRLIEEQFSYLSGEELDYFTGFVLNETPQIGLKELTRNRFEKLGEELVFLMSSASFGNEVWDLIRANNLARLSEVMLELIQNLEHTFRGREYLTDCFNHDPGVITFDNFKKNREFYEKERYHQQSTDNFFLYSNIVFEKINFHIPEVKEDGAFTINNLKEISQNGYLAYDDFNLFNVGYFKIGLKFLDLVNRKVIKIRAEGLEELIEERRKKTIIRYQYNLYQPSRINHRNQVKIRGKWYPMSVYNWDPPPNEIIIGSPDEIKITLPGYDKANRSVAEYRKLNQVLGWTDLMFQTVDLFLAARELFNKIYQWWGVGNSGDNNPREAYEFGKTILGSIGEVIQLIDKWEKNIGEFAKETRKSSNNIGGLKKPGWSGKFIRFAKQGLAYIAVVVILIDLGLTGIALFEAINEGDQISIITSSLKFIGLVLSGVGSLGGAIIATYGGIAAAEAAGTAWAAFGLYISTWIPIITVVVILLTIIVIIIEESNTEPIFESWFQGIYFSRNWWAKEKPIDYNNPENKYYRWQIESAQNRYPRIPTKEGLIRQVNSFYTYFQRERLIIEKAEIFNRRIPGSVLEEVGLSLELVLPILDLEMGIFIRLLEGEENGSGKLRAKSFIDDNWLIQNNRVVPPFWFKGFSGRSKELEPFEYIASSSNGEQERQSANYRFYQNPIIKSVPNTWEFTLYRRYRDIFSAEIKFYDVDFDPQKIKFIEVDLMTDEKLMSGARYNFGLAGNEIGFQNYPLIHRSGKLVTHS
ncbi:MAG: hypothetical protein AAF927_03825 [Bacteroidota bacterium]